VSRRATGPGLDHRLAHVGARLAQLVDAHGGPGVSLAVGHAGEVFTTAAGVANLDTGQPATPETKLLIGSNTRSMTIALMCRAADDGLVDLDGLVLDYLPTFRTAEDATTRAVTIRHLLLHTSGIGGDFFRDFGRGDDAIARLVDALPDAGVAHPVGLCWAYSNAAYVVAGRILEVVYGRPYAQVLREQLLTPLGMTDTALTPEESILGPTAVGHVTLAAAHRGLLEDHGQAHVVLGERSGDADGGAQHLGHRVGGQQLLAGG